MATPIWTRAAAPRTPRLASCQFFLEALPPRRVAQLPAEVPLGLGVRKAVPFRHHAHHHLASEQPGQPLRDSPRRLCACARRQIRKPLADRGWLVIDDVEYAR